MNTLYLSERLIFRIFCFPRVMSVRNKKTNNVLIVHQRGGYHSLLKEDVNFSRGIIRISYSTIFFDRVSVKTSANTGPPASNTIRKSTGQTPFPFTLSTNS